VAGGGAGGTRALRVPALREPALRESALRALDGDDAVESVRARCADEILAADFYSVFRAAGYGLGPSFQWLESIWQGDGEALARLRMPRLRDAVDAYRLYPGLIDSCFQSLAACWRSADVAAENDTILVPFNIRAFQCHRAQPEGDLWCHTRIRTDGSSPDGAVIADMRLFDANGGLVAEVSGFEGRKASRQALLRSLRSNLEDALYELAWRPAPAEAEAALPARGQWLVFCDADPAGGQLAQLLRGRGHDCVVATTPAMLLSELGNRSWPEIVHLSLAADGCDSVLELLRAIATSGSHESPRLWLVTRNAVPAGPEKRALALEQSPLWGLGRVIALEHPELRCVRVDLDTLDEGAGAELLLSELAQPGREDQVAFRGGQRYVARLARVAGARRPARSDAAGGAYKLAMSSFGILDELRLEPLARRAPGRGEIEIAVRANGLNLRDVLLALGMFNAQLADLGITRPADVSFGFECAGAITAVGEGVDHFQPGDEVMGLTLGGMNSHVIADANLFRAKPAGMSFEDAATIPLAFLSAHLGLHHLARLQPGERVLIHAAAGGVGQAAVQLARNLGAEIFATASPGKWDTLAAQGIRHIMSSRTVDFAAEIQALTGGRGVDCVLNSLAGELIPKSLEVLAEGGRFVELGRIGTWTEEQVRQVRPDVRYFNFDMAQECRDHSELIASLFREITSYFEEGTLQPIAKTSFPIHDAPVAFRFMAQAKHIGKIVLTHAVPDAERDGLMVRSDAAYVITGGLGALGLQFAEWMVGKGARQLLLTSRSEPSAEAQDAIARMRATGATVSVVQADVSDRLAVEELLRTASALGPVRGIVHAAGVLDDGILLKQTPEQFRRVMKPKVDGARNLHEASERLPLDFFLCYSSMASLLGSPGQGNYAAANAYLDALAHHRRASGLPALTLNWGAWTGAGMAARVDAHGVTRWSAQGLGLIDPDLALDLIEPLWARGAVQVGVQPLNWAKFLRQIPAGAIPPLLEAFAGEALAHDGASAVPETSKFLEELERAPESDRLQLLQDELRAQIAAVLRIASPEDIELRARLFDLGLDSLMAVELKTRIERTLCFSLRPTLVFDYPTIEALAGHFAQETLVRFFAPPVEETPALETEPEDEGSIAEELARELLDIERGGGR
jgi:myxalamid-type polyketide synthase MxaB